MTMVGRDGAGGRGSVAVAVHFEHTLLCTFWHGGIVHVLFTQFSSMPV